MKLSRKRKFLPRTIVLEEKREAEELLSALLKAEETWKKEGGGYTDRVPKTVSALISQLKCDVEEDTDE